MTSVNIDREVEVSGPSVLVHSFDSHRTNVNPTRTLW